MSVKSRLLDVLERPLLGAPARLIGRPFRGRRRLMGLTNPFYIPTLVIHWAGGRYISERQSYLALGAKNGDVVRLDPDLFEAEISYLIQTLVAPDDTVLDIGANVGVHTVALAKIVCNGHVFAFEPVAEMAERNSQNCALNGVTNVTIMQCALGSENQTLTMKVNSSGAGLEGTSSFVSTSNIESNPGRYAESDIPVRRLDDVMEEQEPENRIGFIKIDTEGFETHVIEGGLRTLRKHRPAMIVEAHTRRLQQAGKSFQWYLDTFPDYHILIIYPVTRANPYLRLEPLTPDQPEIAVNLLLLPKTNRWSPEQEPETC